MSFNDNLIPVSQFEKLASLASSSIRELRKGYEIAFSSYKDAVNERGDLECKLNEANEVLEAVKEESENLLGRYELLCSAISPKKTNTDKYERFNALINDQLLPLINRINVLSNEAEQVLKIKSIDDEMRLNESLDSFGERSIVAVAGGFSSGKSSFVSSLFENEDILLPIGVEPVTAIPTYVFHAEELAISGYPTAGGKFDIPQQVYSKLSYQFVEDFGFNLRDLLPFASLEVPMKSLKNLAFIDLPGYDPGDRDGTTSEDHSISEEYINQAQALLWMIGLDSNGTIPKDDLDHLFELSENNIPLYIVLNKADLRPLDALDDVLDQVSDELMMYGIPYLGLSAYSSENGGELSFRERSIWDVLEEWDKPRENLDSIVNKLEEIFVTYENALLDSIDKNKNKSALVKALELNLLEIGAFDTSDYEPFEISQFIGDAVELDGFDKKESNEAQCKNEKILEVREQIQDLRDDYRVDKMEKNLKELCVIRQSFLELLGGRLQALNTTPC